MCCPCGVAVIARQVGAVVARQVDRYSSVSALAWRPPGHVGLGRLAAWRPQRRHTAADAGGPAMATTSADAAAASTSPACRGELERTFTTKPPAATCRPAEPDARV